MLRLIVLCCGIAIAASAPNSNIFQIDLDPEEAAKYINNPPFAEPQLSARTAVLPLIKYNDPSFRAADAGPTLGHYWKNGREIENTNDYLDEVYNAKQYHGQDGLGAYAYGYEAPESAKVENRQRSGNVQGSYVFKSGSNNDLIKVRYWADSQGFHQEDNIPKYVPKPVEEAPEVRAARIAHEKAWQEAAYANLHPGESQNQNTNLPPPPNYNTYSQNQQYQNQNQQYPNQNQQYPDKNQQYQNPNQQYPNQNQQYPNQNQQYPNKDQQYQNPNQQYPNQNQQYPNKNQQYQNPTQQYQNQNQQYQTQNYQNQKYQQDYQTQASEQQTSIVAAPNQQASEQQHPIAAPNQQASEQQHSVVADHNQQASEQQNSIVAAPNQNRQERAFEQNRYQNQYQGQNQYQIQNQYQNPNQEYTTTTTTERYEEGPTGPPRGFFYSYEYPVDIIVAKSDLQGGPVNPGYPVDHDTVAHTNP